MNLLVFNVNESLEENKILFWLNSIYARAPNSRVMLIGTFIDQLKDEKGRKWNQIEHEKGYKDLKKQKELLQPISNRLEKLMNDWSSSLPSNHSLQFIKCAHPYVGNLMFWPVSCSGNTGIHHYEGIIYRLKELTIGRAVRKNLLTIIEQLKQQKQENKRKTPIMSVEEIYSLIKQFYEDPKVKKQYHFLIFKSFLIFFFKKQIGNEFCDARIT